jgi:hypothetical protein
MENLPVHVYIVFVLTTALTVFLLYRSAARPKKMMLLILGWLVVQSAIALTGFYKITNTMPPRLIGVLLPPLALIIFLFVSIKGRQWVDRFDPARLTLLHVIRIPVELVLFWLSSYKLIPELITFEGINFDIFSGITAPLVYYFGYVKKSLPRSVLLFWNVACLGLLLNVVIHALLAIPTPFQQFAFDQPNIGVALFPFIWLPCFIIMAVLFAHLACIRQLIGSTKQVPVIANN